jgi:NADH-quinone oxidoreductase subunit N
MNIGAFAVITLLEKEGEMDATGQPAARALQRQPLLAAVMAIFMFSLAGVPPFAGFFAKFYVFAAAVQGGCRGWRPSPCSTAPSAPTTICASPW